MTTNQIYLKYQTPTNLQEHMLRVASLASIILDNWEGERLNTSDTISCALFHDIAKPVTFNPDKQKQFVKSEKELEEMTILINNMINRYGLNEHEAVVRIFREIGLNDNTIRLIENLEWIYLPRLMKENDMESLVLIYSDMRIGTKGIISLHERFKELKRRASFSGMDEVYDFATRLENLIQSMTSIDLASIRDEEVESNFRILLNKDII